MKVEALMSGADLGGGCRGCAPPSPSWDEPFFFVYTYSLLKSFTPPSVTSFLSGAPPPRKNPGSSPGFAHTSQTVTLPLRSRLNVMLKSRTIREVLTQEVFLVLAVSIYFGKVIDTLNVSAQWNLWKTNQRYFSFARAMGPLAPFLLMDSQSIKLILLQT